MKQLLLKLANSIRLIAWIYAGSLLLSATLFSIVEGRTFLDGLWWSCATALTIGYGDIAPVTQGGKLLGLFFAHLWVLITIPLVVANIIVKVIEDRNAFTDSEQELIKQQLAECLRLLKEKDDHENRS